MRLTIVLVVTFILGHCHNNTVSLEGTWKSEADSSYLINFNGEILMEIYKEDTNYTKYNRMKESCSNKYLDDNNEPNLDFISLDDGRCFEIVGISDSILSCRYTKSGKLLVFYKIK